MRSRVRLPAHLPRIALLVCLALLVISLGLVFKPGNPPEPLKLTVSERTRAAALADALQLRDSGEQLGAAAGGPAVSAPAAGAPAGSARTVLMQTVSLLTTHARALLRPGQAPAAASSTPSPASAPATAAGLASALASSGRQRLADAGAADGGTARLLAAVGTAQLLQSTALAAAAGAPDPASGPPDPGPAVPTAAAGSCPTAGGSPSSAPVASAGTPSGSAGLPGALAALVSSESETIYGYQVALTRLDGAAAKSAAEQLAHHEALLAGVESLSRSHCASIPPQEPGYALDPAFLASPGPGLAALESTSLPAYGDLVALSDGDTRQWAIAGLLGAARRTAIWGAAPGPMPGLAVDPASLPALPAG
ncbi:hypothetical protein ABIB14_000850 [Arthrobacter sp. UYEF3]